MNKIWIFCRKCTQAFCCIVCVGLCYVTVTITCICEIPRLHRKCCEYTSRYPHGWDCARNLQIRCPISMPIEPSDVRPASVLFVLLSMLYAMYLVCIGVYVWHSTMYCMFVHNIQPYVIHPLALSIRGLFSNYGCNTPQPMTEPNCVCLCACWKHTACGTEAARVFELYENHSVQFICEHFDLEPQSSSTIRVWLKRLEYVRSSWTAWLTHSTHQVRCVQTSDTIFPDTLTTCAFFGWFFFVSLGFWAKSLRSSEE